MAPLCVSVLVVHFCVCGSSMCWWFNSSVCWWFLCVLRAHQCANVSSMCLWFLDVLIVPQFADDFSPRLVVPI